MTTLIGVDVWRYWRAAIAGAPLPAELPTGFGGTDGHPQPGCYKRREGGGYRDGQKQDVSWIPVKIMLVDQDGSVAHKWGDGLTLRAVQGKDTVIDDVHKLWAWCKTNPIDQKTYTEARDSGRWPEEPPVLAGGNPPEPVTQQTLPAADVDEGAPAGIGPGVGHNSEGDPDGAEALAALLRQHEAAIEAWLAVEREGELAANKAANWLGDLRKLSTRVDAAYDKENAPILEAQRSFRAKWQPITGLMDAVKKRMSTAYAAIGEKERARKQAIADAEAHKRAEELRVKLEAERQAAIKAQAAEFERQRAARAAEEAERQAAWDAAGRMPELPLEPVPEPVAPPPPPPVVVPVVVAETVRFNAGGSTGAKIGLKPVKTAVITDWEAAAKHYANADKVREAVQKLANADAKRGIACPGCKIAESMAAA